MTRLLLFYRH